MADRAGHRSSRRRFVAATGALVLGCGQRRIDFGDMRRRGEPIAWKQPRIDAEIGLGPIDAIPQEHRWAFAPDGFEPLPVAAKGDWLAEHHEDPQPVGAFLLAEPNRPAPPRTTICLTALGDLGDLVPHMDDLHDYLGRFFGLPVALVEPVALPFEQLDQRFFFGRRQLRTGAILDELEQRLPAHAYCMLAVTREDLYPGRRWNFVFGQARLHERVGVLSLLRYDPSFDENEDMPDGTALRRGLKVVSHEVGHMFGITHCVHHACVMNGINHVAELDRSPMHLCRVCLRKLHLVVDDLDLVARYEKLRDRYLAAGMLGEAAWVQSRLAARPT